MNIKIRILFISFIINTINTYCQVKIYKSEVILYSADVYSEGFNFYLSFSDSSELKAVYLPPNLEPKNSLLIERFPKQEVINYKFSYDSLLHLAKEEDVTLLIESENLGIKVFNDCFTENDIFRFDNFYPSKIMVNEPKCNFSFKIGTFEINELFFCGRFTIKEIGKIRFIFIQKPPNDFKSPVLQDCIIISDWLEIPEEFRTYKSNYFRGNIDSLIEASKLTEKEILILDSILINADSTLKIKE